MNDFNKPITQPMTQQNAYFYQNKNMPNPSNINQLNPNLGNFQTVFNPLPSIPFNGIQPKGNFSNNGFINKGDLLHNDLHNILLNEEIREYSVLIDSKDRNYQVYPDPFSYNVKFSPLPTSREKIGNKVITYEDPNPVINDNFINVRYIKLEDVILPLYTKIRNCREKMDDEIIDTSKIDIYSPMTENLYVVLSIGEYKDVNYRSTNDVLSDSFATIYFDEKISDTHYRGYTHNGIKIFQQDQLAKIDKLKIQFMDPYGKPLSVNHVDKKIKSGMECTCDDPSGDENTDCFKHNLYHPLNPIFQHHLHFKIGVLEPRLNKITFN